MIKISHLKKSFGDLNILKDINLEIPMGKTLALLGKSGSGKSTLMSMMCGLEEIDVGEVNLDGVNLKALSPKELSVLRAKQMGIVFQQFHLISSLTAQENVALPLKMNNFSSSDERSLELLEKVGLSSRALHYPHELSGGEAQRVAIARALAHKPKFLFADEPSGNLDQETGALVMELLFKLVRDEGTTLILVTHDQELAQRCDRVVRLEHGVIVG